MPRPPTPSVDAFLCEGCGYDLSPLAAGGVCPECGRARAASDPGLRVGTAWQRGPGPVAFVKTCGAVLGRPRGVWDVVRGEGGGGFAFGLHAMLVASLVMSVAIAVPGPRVAGAHVGYLVAFTLGSFVSLLGLTMIEYRGIRFFASRRGLRVTRGVASNVVGHASVGWVVGALLAGPAWQVVQRLPGVWEMDLRVSGNVVLPAGWAPMTLVVLAMGAGLMVFEVLVYWGVLGMRWANTGAVVSAARGRRVEKAG